MSNTIKGILEINSNGIGYLRNPIKNFEKSKRDPRVPKELVKNLKLREGTEIEAEFYQKPAPKNTIIATNILKFNGLNRDIFFKTIKKNRGASINPEIQLKMSQGKDDVTGEIIDLISPIAKGQRGLIISPPKAGKTTILKHIAKSTMKNNPEVKVIVLLVDERPEEITDFQRDLDGAMVFHSSLDKPPENHLRITRLTIKMAMRLLECGHDILVLIDSLTRLARTSNNQADSQNRTLSGGLGIKAMEEPRRILGSARNIEHGGSMTIIASILIDTGSRMDEIIYNEYKGTCNMDLTLSRECAEQRVFPAIHINESATRKENLILSRQMSKKSVNLRRLVAREEPVQALKTSMVFLNVGKAY